MCVCMVVTSVTSSLVEDSLGQECSHMRSVTSRPEGPTTKEVEGGDQREKGPDPCIFPRPTF